MVFCVAFGCTNNSKGTKPRAPGERMGFFRFPKDPKQRKMWIKNIRRANWTPRPDSRLCSAHFTEDQINFRYYSMLRLRDGAIPTVFPAHPKHLQPSSNLKTSKTKLYLPDARYDAEAIILESSGYSLADESRKCGNLPAEDFISESSVDPLAVEQRSDVTPAKPRQSLECSSCVSLKNEVARLREIIRTKISRNKDENREPNH